MPRSLSDWLSALERLHPADIELGLARCGAVWKRLGAPRPAPRVVTVAGTNGKGSVCACLEAAFVSLGYRTGCYASPHVFRFNERIRIDGREARDRELVEAFEAVEAARGDTPLTFFEFTTLAAFWHMMRVGCEAAVLEVGLGGRLDAVNLVDADVAVITPVGLDHQEWLGPDREHIGAEKAGIVRAGRPLVCGDPEPPESVLSRARDLGAPLTRIGRDFVMERAGDGGVFVAGGRRLAVPAPAMGGGHQWRNLATALAALDAALPAWREHADDVVRAARGARLRGRLEPIGADPVVIVDVGHNEMAARTVARGLGGAARPVYCVVAMLRDKDAAACARALAPRVDRWFCASLPGPRGARGEDLAARLREGDPDAAPAVFDDVEAALQAALERCPRTGTVLVFGSFLTAERALRHIEAGLASTPGDAARI